MRHKKSFNHLSRTSAHRKAMLSNMASSLIMHKRIETTTAKAKALKRYVEPLITRSKDDTTHSRRVVFSYLQDKEAVTELFREVSAKVADRPGGYTRIIRLGNRLGDNADMCLIELVDFNENLLAEKAASKKSSSRRRRGGGKKKVEETTAGEAAVAEEVAEEVTDKAVAEEVAEEVVAEEIVEEAPAEEVVAEEVVEEAPAEEPVAEEPKAEAPAEEESKEEEPAKDDDKKET
ncbi:MAG: 50S ribosomal protein L17 [Bacteroidota bacterium]|nr:50S ribosomal protein L17 [Bacteroidota bacterium]